MSPRAGLNLQMILQAAAEIANLHGLEEVTLASLAKKLNVRSPSLYNHIEGLPSLRQKLAVYGMNQLALCLNQAANGKLHDEAIRSLARAYVDFARTNAGLYESILRFADMQEKETQHAANKVVQVVLGILQDYGLDDEQMIHIVRGLRSLLHGFASLEQNGGFGLPIHLETSLEVLIDTYIAGIYSLAETKI